MKGIERLGTYRAGGEKGNCFIRVGGGRLFRSVGAERRRPKVVITWLIID